MARDDAKRFVDALESDRRLVEELRPKVTEGADVLALYLDAAKAMGLDVTGDELEAELKAKTEDLLAQVGAAELSEEELEQVAGGGGSDCKNSYEEHEICWFADQCTDLLILYNHNDDCRTTYVADESCTINDRCIFLVNFYDGR